MIRAKHVLFILSSSFNCQETDYQTVTKHGNPLLFRVLSYFDQDSHISDIYNHGCWCGILKPLDGESPSIKRGKPIDTLDQICRDWSFCKNCIGKEITCTSQTIYTYLRPEFNSDTFSCQVAQTDECARERCLCDTTAARQISNYLKTHDFQPVNTFTPENERLCRTGDSLEPKDRCCKTKGLAYNYWVAYNSQKYECSGQGKLISNVVRSIEAPDAASKSNPKKRRRKQGKKTAKVNEEVRPTTARPITTRSTTTKQITTTTTPEIIIEESNSDEYYYYQYQGAADPKASTKKVEAAQENEDYMPVFDEYDYTTASPNKDEQTTAADFGNGGAGYDDQGEWWWYE